MGCDLRGRLNGSQGQTAVVIMSAAALAELVTVGPVREDEMDDLIRLLRELALALGAVYEGSVADHRVLVRLCAA
jgi:hypothetical protein